MNRYQWLMWAFRLFFSGEVIAEVKKMASQLETSNACLSGTKKRDFIEESVMPSVKSVGVFLLRGLIEVILYEVTASRSNDETR